MSTTGHETEAINVQGLQASLRKGGNKAIYNEATCSTAADTDAKEVTLGTTFNLVTGATILVKFTNGISVANATLTVTHTPLGASEAIVETAKPIYLNGAALAANVIPAGAEIILRYDGTKFNVIGGGDRYILPKAAANTLGGIKVGKNLSIDNDGVLSSTNDKDASTGTTGDNPYNGMGRVTLDKNMVNNVNLLTQDMFYKGETGSRVPNTNTIFIIQYDYSLGEIEKEDVTIDGGSSTEISNTTYYYTTIELEAGKCLRLLDVEHCVLLNGTTALLKKKEVIATEDTTVYIASTTADTYTEAYSIENVITIPANCMLDFQGGSISNGTVVLNDTVLSGEVNFKDVAINGFFRRENFSQRPCFYLEDFGGKANDQEVDNGPALQKAIDTANRVGGIVRFKAGRYYFSTGVQIADRLVVMTIEGSGFRADSSINAALPDAGTALVWQGTGWFMTFNGPIWKCIFRDFSVFCENNNGIKFIGSVFLTTLENLNVRGFINGISIGHCAYCVVRMCEIGSADYNVENNIIIGDTGSIEYLFMYNLAMQNDDQHGTALNVYNGRHVYIKDCDIVQMDRAVYVHTEATSRWFNVEDTDIANCNLAFDINLTHSGLLMSNFIRVVVNTQEVMPTETVEIDGQQVTRQKCCILRGQRASGYSMEGSNIDIIINKQGELATNLIDIPQFFAGRNCVIRLNSNTEEKNDANAYSPYKVGNNGMTVYSNRRNDAYAVEVKGDGTSTTLDIPLGTDFYSSFTLPNTVPCIVQSRNDNIASYTLGRSDGVLKVTITFKATFTDRDYITIYLPQLFEVRYIDM